jgi:hypothetical protein
MKLHFTRTNGPADEAIDKLIELTDGIRRPEYVREMILASLKAGQEDDDSADLKLMNTTLKEMRFTSKVFGPYRDKRKVTVFGSARTQPGEPVYEMAKLFGQRLAEAGYMVITGGGGGIMRAANEGAGLEHSFGVNIRLPFERNQPRDRGQSGSSPTNISLTARSLSSGGGRRGTFPGGFGTLDEAMETLTWSRPENEIVAHSWTTRCAPTGPGSSVPPEGS